MIKYVSRHCRCPMEGKNHSWLRITGTEHGTCIGLVWNSSGQYKYNITHSWEPLCNLKFSSSHQSVSQFSRSVMSDSLRPHELQHARPPCPSPTPRVHSNSYPSSRWCHPAISSSVVPFSSCPQSFPASGSFPMSHLFTSGGKSIGVSASTSVLPMNTWDWSPLG